MPVSDGQQPVWHIGASPIYFSRYIRKCAASHSAESRPCASHAATTEVLAGSFDRHADASQVGAKRTGDRPRNLHHCPAPTEELARRWRRVCHVAASIHRRCAKSRIEQVKSRHVSSPVDWQRISTGSRNWFALSNSSRYRGSTPSRD